jgi:hypothetical protein
MGIRSLSIPTQIPSRGYHSELEGHISGENGLSKVQVHFGGIIWNIPEYIIPLPYENKQRSIGVSETLHGDEGGLPRHVGGCSSEHNGVYVGLY